MATWDAIREIVSRLPETSEASTRGSAVWTVKGKTIVWERPLRRGDYEALGNSAPDGPILAAWVPDLGVKEALISDDPDVYFTTPHFDGYPAILVCLDEIDTDELEELIIEAWLDRAPRRLASEYLKTDG
jgi:hypothetical protein